ncbi:MAG: hypothetical protein ACO1SV_23405 [Fimbriimonas sp.]
MPSLPLAFVALLSAAPQVETPLIGVFNDLTALKGVWALYIAVSHPVNVRSGEEIARRLLPKHGVRVLTQARAGTYSSSFDKKRKKVVFDGSRSHTL